MFLDALCVRLRGCVRMCVGVVSWLAHDHVLLLGTYPFFKL